MTDQSTPKQTKSEQVKAQRIAQQEEQRRIFGSSPFYSGRAEQAAPARPAAEIEDDGFITSGVVSAGAISSVASSTDYSCKQPYVGSPHWQLGESPRDTAFDALKEANQLFMRFNQRTKVEINGGEYALDLINRYTPEQLITIFREEDGFHTWKLLQEIMRLRAALQGHLK